MKTHADMFVTVAICTWNRAALLRQTLEQMTHLEIQAHTTWELLIVNNNCTDDTNQVVKAFESRLPIRLVYEPTPGLSNARNRAVSECRSTHILFTDDDVLVDPTWLRAFRDAVDAYPHAAAFGGPIAPWFPVEPSPDVVEFFPSILDGFCGIDHCVPLGLLPVEREIRGANMAFSIPRLSGARFDPQLGVNGNNVGGFEETALVAALRQRGNDVVWVPGMRIRHYVDPQRLKIGYLIKLARDRGTSEVLWMGQPKGRRILGAPHHLWRRWLSELVKSAAVLFTGRGVRAAAQFAKAERYRGKLIACRSLSAVR